MNRAKCKNCGTILHSTHRHDFVACRCFKEDVGNLGIYIDGGDDYIRIGGCKENYEQIPDDYEISLKRGRRASDEWRTPIELYRALDAEFYFDFDVCATEKNKLAEFKGDYFTNKFQFCTCFMHPPYSAADKFVERARELQVYAGVTTVCLLKADPSCKLFSLLWNFEKQEPHPRIHIRFLPSKLKFTQADGCTTKQANFPSMIVVLYAMGISIIDQDGRVKPYLEQQKDWHRQYPIFTTFNATGKAA